MTLNRYGILTFLIVAITLVLDLSAPTGSVMWILYACALMTALCAGGISAMTVLLLIITLLTLVAPWLGASDHSGDELMRRLCGIFVFTLITGFCWNELQADGVIPTTAETAPASPTVLSVASPQREDANEALLEERERYAQLFDHVPIGIWEEDFTELGRWLDDLRQQGVTDLRRWLVEHPEKIREALSLIRILNVNQTAVRQNGAESKEDLLDHLRDLKPIFDDVSLNPMIEELVGLWEQRGVIVFELDGRRLDGSLLSSIVRIHIPRKDGKPDLSRVILTGTDITDRRQAERERDRFFTMSLDLLSIADFSGNLVRVNPAFERVLGFTEEELLSKRYLHFVHPDDRERSLQEMERLREGQDLISFENRLRCQDGTYVWLKWTATPDPLMSRVYAVASDVTKAREAAIALQRAKDEAVRANQAKSELLANVSHDLRTPMNGILGLTEIVLGTELETRQREFLEMVQLSAKSLLTMINDLLDLGRIEAGKLDLVEIPFRLRDTLCDVLRALSIRTEEKGVELTWYVAPEVPEMLIGDPARVDQILVNLVGNAIKFTEKGEVAVHVTLANQNERTARLQLAISDTGIGIAPEHLARIFSPFEQAEQTTHQQYGGSGLGLAIVAKLVRLMNGTVNVESEVGKGTTFHVELEPGIDPHAAETEDAPPQELADLQVLLLEDNARTALLLQEALQSWGMKVAVVSTVREAEQFLRNAQTENKVVDVLLLDAHQVEDANNAIYSLLEEHPTLNQATLLLATAQQKSRLASETMPKVVGDCITRPIKLSEVQHHVRQALDSGLAYSVVPQSARPSTATVMRPMHVLLAEDNHVNQMVAVHLLQQWGHEVTVAENGRQALKELEQAKFDLVLMDLRMPVMDGYEAIVHLREGETGTDNRVPVIALTAQAMKGDRENCLEQGFDGYVTKPINSEELRRTILDIGTTTVPLDSPERETTKSPQPLQPPETKEEFVSKAYNHAEALERSSGDEDLLQSLIRVFLQELPEKLGAIEKSISESNAEQLQLCSHSLKGAASCLASALVEDSAFALEKIGASGDLSEASTHWEDLRQNVEKLRSALEEVVASQSV